MGGGGGGGWEDGGGGWSGITPYYCSSVFIGHDFPINKLKSGASGGDYAAPLWQAYMEKIHKGLPDKEIIDTDPESLGIIKRKICSVSGLLATDACRLDADHKPVTEPFLYEDVPEQYCDMHVVVSTCKDSGAIATQFCPSDRVTEELKVLVSSENQLFGLELMTNTCIKRFQTRLEQTILRMSILGPCLLAEFIWKVLFLRSQILTRQNLL